MASVNKCIFIGNVTKDPEIRYAPSGDGIANFSIAVNESWKDKNGQKQERVEFVNVVAYRKLAEIIGEYLRKGASVYIEGKMQTRKWQTKDGQDRYTTEIIADQMQMLGGRDADSGGSQERQRPADRPAPATAGGSSFDEFADDIPPF